MNPFLYISAANHGNSPSLVFSPFTTRDCTSLASPHPSVILTSSNGEYVTSSFVEIDDEDVVVDVDVDDDVTNGGAVALSEGNDDEGVELNEGKVKVKVKGSTGCSTGLMLLYVWV